MTPDMDESARILTRMLRERKPFFFARIGDGAIELLSGKPGKTCDGEEYSPELADQIWDVLDALEDSHAWLGDWRTATNGSPPRLMDSWLIKVIPTEKRLLHFEALLLNRESDALVDFYRAVREDTRRKMHLGQDTPSRETADFLCAHHQWMTCPRGGVYDELGDIVAAIESAAPDVLLFGAGLAGLVAAVRYWVKHPDSTCIHLGSALDPLFFGKTRNGQLSQYKCMEMFKDML